MCVYLYLRFTLKRSISDTLSCKLYTFILCSKFIFIFGWDKILVYRCSNGQKLIYLIYILS